MLLLLCYSGNQIGYIKSNCPPTLLWHRPRSISNTTICELNDTGILDTSILDSFTLYNVVTFTRFPVRVTRVKVKHMDRDVPSTLIALLNVDKNFLRINSIAKLVLHFTQLTWNFSYQLAVEPIGFLNHTMSQSQKY